MMECDIVCQIQCSGAVSQLYALLQAAQKALGYEPDASAIAAASKLLLDASCEARRRVRLRWPYGGGSVEVAGDVVGGWHVRTPLQESADQQGCTTVITVRLHTSLPALPGIFVNGAFTHLTLTSIKCWPCE